MADIPTLVTAIVKAGCQCDVMAGVSCGIHEPVRELAKLATAAVRVAQDNATPRELLLPTFTGDFCPDCGDMLRFVEGCKKCLMPGCGYSRC